MARRLADLDEALRRYDERRLQPDTHPIPRMRYPLGVGWTQPDRSRILVDATHAVMDKAAFEELMEYSGTKPTGIYSGKMWRRHDGLFDLRFRANGGRRPVWMLCWYAPCDEPNYFSTNYRIILLLDGDLPEAGA